MPARPAISGWDGSRLATLRRRTGLTQAELAKAIGVAKLTVYFWESNLQDRSPSPPNLVAIAKVLKVATTDLVPLPDPPTLAAYREHAGLRQGDLAEQLGVKNTSTISAIERDSKWWPDYAERWAQQIGVTDRQFREAWEAGR